MSGGSVAADDAHIGLGHGEREYSGGELHDCLCGFFGGISVFVESKDSNLKTVGKFS